MKELQPINQQVILDITDPKDEQRTASGIIIPDVAKEKPRPGRLRGWPLSKNAEIKPGDTVLYKPSAELKLSLKAGNI
jgi:chaperonin GroES